MNQRFIQNRRRASVVTLLVIVNTLVFIAWSLSGQDNSDSSFMVQNFLISWQALQEGRFWTLLTSAFSHNMFWHFFMNMYVLASFGPIMERTLGRSRFLIFYLTAGVLSSLCHGLVSAFILHEPNLPALGASGAISGVILLFSLLYPRQTILIFGLIPIPAVGGALLFVGLDIWGLIAQAEGGGLPIGHGAHLGGAFTGIMYYFLFLRRRIRTSL